MVDNKIIEKLIEALCVAVVSGTIWWISKVIQTYADSKVRSRELARDMAHIMRNQEALSLAISSMDVKFDEFSDRLFDLDKKVLLVDARVKFGRNNEASSLGINLEDH